MTAFLQLAAGGALVGLGILCLAPFSWAPWQVAAVTAMMYAGIALFVKGMS